MSKLVSLFRKPDLPEPEAPTPLPDEETLRRARRRRIAEERQRSGVNSTNLGTGARETMGG